MSWITIAMLLAGIALLVGGADLLVRGASRLATSMGISPLVVGLTVVAYGTSAPELAVSIHAILVGQADIAIGNVVGSNIANVLLILGVSALVAPLAVAQQLIRLDVPLMVLISGVLLGMSWNGVVSPLEGAILFAGAIAYTLFAIRKSRSETRAVKEEYEQEYGASPAEERKPARIATDFALIAVGIFLLWLGSRWLVTGATTLAEMFHISSLVIGLTVVAVGTSLPELATSVVAAARGERDISVGNVVGSNIFNILAVLGLSAAVVPGGVHVSESAIGFDIPVMLVVAVACLPVFFSGSRIERWEGAFFLFYYGAYTTYVVMKATDASRMILFERVMIWFVLPITAVTLAVVTIFEIRKRSRSHPEE
ncbi:MAG: calcium/sodium antiporter [Thermoanaerobaculia bacterium]